MSLRSAVAGLTAGTPPIRRPSAIGCVGPGRRVRPRASVRESPSPGAVLDSRGLDKARVAKSLLRTVGTGFHKLAVPAQFAERRIFYLGLFEIFDLPANTRSDNS